MKGLKVSEGRILPLDAVTQTLGCIGRKGSGKTYLATMIAEQMLDAHAQVVALDPVGNWWGLRVAADGKSAGKEIFVLGGDHGDVALIPEAGAKIAKLIVEKGISAVLDLSPFRQGERKRFAADFAEELFHLKKTQRSAMHLFVEEAQLFAPQRSGPDEARMLGAFENIVRLGRNYGIGCTLVTQRPQSVNKEVLSQVECLCVLQVNGTHERKALDEWVQEAGADRKLVGQLPGLARGEGFIWSPSWLRIFERVHFSQKQTFDASATPEVGRAAKAASLSAVDVEAIKADLAEVVAKAEQDDPRKLRARISELEREARKPRELAVDTAALEREYQRGKSDFHAMFVREIRDEVDGMLEHLRSAVATAESLRARSIFANVLIDEQPLAKASRRLREFSQIGQEFADRVQAVSRSSPKRDTSGGLPKAERLILTALAQHGACSKAKIAILTGYAVSGGGFNNALSALRQKGLITKEAHPDILPSGKCELGDYDPLPEGAQLLEHWVRQLGKAEASALRVLVSAYPNALPKDQIARAAGYEPNGGGFNNALSRLRTLELAKGRSTLRASDSLFG